MNWISGLLIADRVGDSGSQPTFTKTVPAGLYTDADVSIALDEALVLHMSPPNGSVQVGKKHAWPS